MPTLYFCQPHAKTQGMLRAFLSMNECERVVSKHPATYVGDQFPKLGSEQEAASDFAVLNIPRDETPAGWQPDRKSTRLNSSHQIISYAVFCLKKKNDISPAAMS